MITIAQELTAHLGALVVFRINNTPAEAFTPPVDKK